MAYEKHPDEVGVLFEKTSKAGKKYFSGKLNGQDIVGFPKEGANGTRIELRVSRPREEQQQKQEAPF